MFTSTHEKSTTAAIMSRRIGRGFKSHRRLQSSSLLTSRFSSRASSSVAYRLQLVAAARRSTALRLAPGTKWP